MNRPHDQSLPPDGQTAVVLVGEAARDHKRIEALLTANVIVILVPSLQTASPLLQYGEEATQVIAPSMKTVGELIIDLTAHRVLWGGRELPVTERDLAILALLSEEAGRARAFTELADRMGGRWPGDSDRVRSAVKRLRKKLAMVGADVTIESVRGYGFRLATRAADGPPASPGGPTPHRRRQSGDRTDRVIALPRGARTE